jgi:hypothetical protein
MRFQVDLPPPETLRLPLAQPGSWMAWKWCDAPVVLREMCRATGGDEDWVMTTLVEPTDLPPWLDVGEGLLDVYLFEGLVVYVLCHS